MIPLAQWLRRTCGRSWTICWRRTCASPRPVRAGRRRGAQGRASGRRARPRRSALDADDGRAVAARVPRPRPLEPGESRCACSPSPTSHRCRRAGPSGCSGSRRGGSPAAATTSGCSAARPSPRRRPRRARGRADPGVRLGAPLAARLPPQHGLRARGARRRACSPSRTPTCERLPAAVRLRRARLALGRRLPSLYSFLSPAPLEYRSRQRMTAHHRAGAAGVDGVAALWMAERACLRRARAFTCMSDFSLALLWKLYRIPAERIVKIPGGVDVERFRPPPTGGRYGRGSACRSTARSCSPCATSRPGWARHADRGDGRPGAPRARASAC